MSRSTSPRYEPDCPECRWILLEHWRLDHDRSRWECRHCRRIFGVHEVIRNRRARRSRVLRREIIIGLVSSLVDRRRKIQKSNSPSVYSSTSKPSKLTWYGVVRHYGADWHVAVGEPRRGSEKYAYIEKGPCCPNCQTEMLHRNTTRLFVLKRRIWLCPECETVIDRPNEMLFEEKRGVKNVVEKHVMAALSTDDPKEYIESVDGFDTGQWGKRHP